MTFVRKGASLTGYHAAAGAIVDGVILDDCEIFSCTADVAESPAHRPVFRNVTMINSVLGPTSLDGAAIENTTVDGVRTFSEFLGLGGCVFNRVILKGFIEFMIISSELGIDYQKELSLIYEAENRLYWDRLTEQQEWALDISDAYGQFELRGIPARLVRRNPRNQIVMTFEQALNGTWRDVPDIRGTGIAGSIRLLLEYGWPDTVLIANPASPTFDDALRILRELQRIGAAEAD